MDSASNIADSVRSILILISLAERIRYDPGASAVEDHYVQVHVLGHEMVSC